MTTSFEQARQVADAVLYEGYVLYPYRASAIKNRYRWQFGVVAPRAYAERAGTDPWFMAAEFLVEPVGDPELSLELRFLQIEERQVEALLPSGELVPIESLTVAGETHTTWQEGVVQTVGPRTIRLLDAVDEPRRIAVSAPHATSGRTLLEGEHRRGRVTRRRWAVDATLLVSAQRIGALLKVSVRIENDTRWRAGAGDERSSALRRATIGTHVLLGVLGGRFLSLSDPPPDAAAAARSCSHHHAWPILIGDPDSADTMLVSPILLDDYPRIAPESPGDLYDATEIDEILTLRIMTLTDDEKAEARSTDDRARRVIERSDGIPAEVFERLHGAIRSLRPIASEPPDLHSVQDATDPWRELLGEETPAEDAELEIGGARVGKGARVLLHPKRRADAMDMFLEGKLATVAAVHHDVENVAYVAVTLDDDPGRDLHDWYGRFYYFYPEEIEPIEADAGTPSARTAKE